MSGHPRTDVAIVGANGYTGGELLRLLAGHPGVRVTATTSRSLAGQALGAGFPQLVGSKTLPARFEDLDPKAVATRAGTAFACLPHGDSQIWVDELRSAGVCVIDLSADYRYSDLELYAASYGSHQRPERNAEAVYGLTEWARDAVATADLIANPGCYPTTVLTALLPALRAGWLDGPVIADCQSGVTGAGRAAKISSLHAEVSEGMAAYGMPKHRHESEICHQAGRFGAREIDVVFTPHLAPANRGILATVQLRLNADIDPSAFRDAYAARYATEPFVHLLPEGQLPRTTAVRGSNHVHLQIVARRPRLFTVFAALDNLGKGAAGQAVQNLNVRLGRAETDGLLAPGLLP